MNTFLVLSNILKLLKAFNSFGKMLHGCGYDCGATDGFRAGDTADGGFIGCYLVRVFLPLQLKVRRFTLPVFCLFLRVLASVHLRVT